MNRQEGKKVHNTVGEEGTEYMSRQERKRGQNALVHLVDRIHE
jgi:hypothetical protein